MFFTGRFELIDELSQNTEKSALRGNNSVKLEAEENKLEKLFIYMYINN